MKRLELLVLVLTSVTFGAEPANFKMYAPLEGQFADQAVLRVKLSPEVIAKTHRHYDDVRLVGDKNEETPFVVYEEAPPELSATQFTFAARTFDEKSGTMVATFEREGTGAFDELTFDLSARDFNKTVKVQWASTAAGPWTDLVTDSIFDFSTRIELRKTSFTIPEADAKFLRAEMTDVKPQPAEGGLQFMVSGGEIKTEVKNKAPAFRITSVTARLTHQRQAVAARETTTLNGQNTTLDEHKNSLVDLGEVALPLTRVTLDVATPFFFRRIEAWGSNTGKPVDFTLIASGTVYRVPGMKDAETSLSLRGAQERFLRLKILNGDNPPLVVSHIRGEWVPVYLYFIGAQGRAYSLYFSADDMRAPNYDLGAVLPASNLGKIAVKDLTLGAVSENAGYQAPGPKSLTTQETRERLIFTLLVIAVTLVVGVWIYRLVGKVSSAL